MTDHKQRAENIVGVGADGGVEYMLEGLVHATLYLAEQQRISNLIAYHAAPDYIREVHDAMGHA